MRRGRPAITAAVQLGNLRAVGFAGRSKREMLDVVGAVQPTSTSETYVVRIQYRVGREPVVTVVSPDLRPLEDGTPVPHVYPGLVLCLFRPGRGEWGPHQLLTLTIVPWAMEWLYYYEAWHCTHEWLGGGEHPEPRRRRPRRRPGAIR